MPELSNENLSLWLKARDGLPCEEARALIEAHNDLDAEFDAHLAEDEGKHSDADLSDAIAAAEDDLRRAHRGVLKTLRVEVDKAFALLSGLRARLDEEITAAESN